MKRIGFVFCFALVLLLIVPHLLLKTSTAHSFSTETNPVSLEVEMKNRSLSSSSPELTIPDNAISTNSVHLNVGNRKSLSFSLMNGESASKVVSVGQSEQKGSYDVHLKKKGFDFDRSKITVDPESFKLSSEPTELKVGVEIPENMTAKKYSGRLVISKGNEEVGTIEVEIDVRERLVEAMNFQEETVREGGCFYKWYRTTPGSEIDLGESLFNYSQPDGNGMFYIEINTSLLEEEKGWKAPYSLNVTPEGAIRRDGELDRINRDLQFELTVEPEKYSTQWTTENKEEAGAGAGLSGKIKRTDSFAIEYDTENDLSLKSDKSYGGLAGAGKSLFSMETGPAKIDFLGASAEISTDYLFGDSRTMDYSNCSEKERVDSALEILNGITSKITPLGGKIISLAMDKEEGWKKDYEYSGLALTGKGEGGVAKAKVVTESNPSGNLAGFQVGSEKTKSVDYTLTNYTRGGEKYSFQTEEELRGTSAFVLGTEFSDGKWIATELNFIEENGDVEANLVRKSKGKDKTKEIYHLPEGRTEFYNRTLGRLDSDSYLQMAGSVWNNNLNEMVSEQGTKKTVVRLSGKEMDLNLPLEVEVSGVGVSVARGLSFSRYNKMITENYFITSQGRKLRLKSSPPKERALRNLSEIFSYSFEPIGRRATEGIDTTVRNLSNGKMEFSNGDLEAKDNGSFLVTTYNPGDYNSRQITSNYLSTLTGSGFVTGNITDLEETNGSEAKGNLSLNYTGEDKDHKIYRWDEENNNWQPQDTDIDEEDNRARTEINDSGSYAIGHDEIKPNITFHGDRIFKNRLIFSSLIVDNGTGINSSSLEVELNGSELNFSYRISTGVLQVNESAPPGNYTLEITASDTSGNRRAVERSIEIIEAGEIAHLNCTDSGENTVLNWNRERGSFPIEKTAIYWNGKHLKNISQGNSYSCTYRPGLYTVYPIDSRGFTGTGKTCFLKETVIIPRFRWIWKRGLRPRNGEKILFNASRTTVLNSKDNDINYTWSFRRKGEEILNRRGETTETVFNRSGKYNVTLTATGNGIKESLSKPVFISEKRKNRTKENSILIQPWKKRKEGKAGSTVEFILTLKNRGGVSDMVKIGKIDCKWDWRLTYNGEEAGFPYPRKGLSDHILKPKESEEVVLTIFIPKEAGENKTTIDIEGHSFMNETETDSTSLVVYSKKASKQGSQSKSSPSGSTVNETEYNETDKEKNEKPGNKTDDEIEVNESEEEKEAETPTGQFTNKEEGRTPLFVILITATVLILITYYKKYHQSKKKNK